MTTSAAIRNGMTGFLDLMHLGSAGPQGRCHRKMLLGLLLVAHPLEDGSEDLVSVGVGRILQDKLMDEVVASLLGDLYHPLKLFIGRRRDRSLDQHLDRIVPRVSFQGLVCHEHTDRPVLGVNVERGSQ